MSFNNWLDISKKTLIFALSVLLIIIGFKVSIFYIPFVIAFIISQLLEPLIRFCMRKLKMKRKISAILIFSIILSIIIGIIVWGIITLITETTNFLNNFNQYFDKISAFSQNIISSFNLDKIQVSDEVKGIANNASSQVIRSSIKLVKRLYNKTTKYINIYTINSIIYCNNNTCTILYVYR